MFLGKNKKIRFPAIKERAAYFGGFMGSNIRMTLLLAIMVVFIAMDVAFWLFFPAMFTQVLAVLIIALLACLPLWLVKKPEYRTTQPWQLLVAWTISAIIFVLMSMGTIFVQFPSLR